MSALRDAADRFLLRKPVDRDEGKLQRDSERGTQAEQLLRHELMQGGFKHLEEIYIDIWRKTDGADIDTRERTHLALRLLDDLRTHLLSVVRDGVAARQQIERSLSRQ